MSATEPGVCACGHYRYIHTAAGCPGWRHSDHFPWWVKALDRVRIRVMLRCYCPAPGEERTADGNLDH